MKEIAESIRYLADHGLRDEYQGVGLGETITQLSRCVDRMAEAIHDLADTIRDRDRG